MRFKRLFLMLEKRVNGITNCLTFLLHELDLLLKCLLVDCKLPLIQLLMEYLILLRRDGAFSKMNLIR